jgi:hypothetical protein
MYFDNFGKNASNFPASNFNTDSNPPNNYQQSSRIERTPTTQKSPYVPSNFDNGFSRTS